MPGPRQQRAQPQEDQAEAASAEADEFHSVAQLCENLTFADPGTASAGDGKGR